MRGGEPISETLSLHATLKKGCAIYSGVYKYLYFEVYLGRVSVERTGLELVVYVLVEVGNDMNPNSSGYYIQVLRSICYLLHATWFCGEISDEVLHLWTLWSRPPKLSYINNLLITSCRVVHQNTVIIPLNPGV